MIRRTKIIATLGPATDEPTILKALFMAGADLVRINFSHGKIEDQLKRIQLARDVAKSINKEIGILGDLQGPKIRIARFKNNKIDLSVGAVFSLDASLDESIGDQTQVGIDYKDLTQDVKAGDRLLLNDGLIVLKVMAVNPPRIECIVEVGGELSNNKGINREGGGLSAKALTDKDQEDIRLAAKQVDYFALSFPRCGKDILDAADCIKACGGFAGVIAKIERVEALENLDEIITASAGVMVARGDLGVEIGDAELPAVQKHIIHRARTLDKPVITATQMMESMIHQRIPTRAEVFDVANAVLDYTDAVMLSAETATGEHPVEAVAAMARVCLSAEKQPETQISKHRIECHFQRIDEAIAMATMYTANHLDIKAIICLTESGSTPLWMSRIRTGIPIYALSRHQTTRRLVTLYRGVYPIEFDVTHIESHHINTAAIKTLLQLQHVISGDLIILTKGDQLGTEGGTNVMKILAV